MSDLLAIGAVAEATGVSVSTLRYYDQIKLIAPTGRVGGKRRFDPASIGRINFVRRAQATGFSLEEIRAILDDSDGNWNEMVADKLAALRSQRGELDVTIRMLEEVSHCGCQVVAECPRLPGPC